MDYKTLLDTSWLYSTHANKDIANEVVDDSAGISGRGNTEEGGSGILKIDEQEQGQGLTWAQIPAPNTNSFAVEEQVDNLSIVEKTEEEDSKGAETMDVDTAAADNGHAEQKKRILDTDNDGSADGETAATFTHDDTPVILKVEHAADIGDWSSVSSGAMIEQGAVDETRDPASSNNVRDGGALVTCLQNMVRTPTATMPLIDYLCMCNSGCTMQELQVHFTNLAARRRMIEHLRYGDLVIYTRHLKPAENNLRVLARDLTSQNANHVYACNGYLSLTVRQYYFAKHGVRLRHPYLPCVIEYGGKAHRSYYPLELLEVRFAADAATTTGDDSSHPRVMRPSGGAGTNFKCSHMSKNYY